MKKFTFLLIAAIMTLTLSAQQVKGKKLAPLPAPTEKEVLSPKQHTFIVPKIHHATKAADKADGVVTPPSDLQVENYRLMSYIFDGNGWEQVSRLIKLGIDGSDVYLKGFSVYLPEAWIKGTISSDGSTVTFPMQYYGNYSGYDLYFYPVDGVTAQVIDAVFNYNVEAGTLVLSQDQVCYILENVGNEGMQIVYQYDSSLSIVPDGDTVQAPEDLETQEYALTGTYMGQSGSAWFDGDPLVGTAKVGFDGDDIYIQGMCSYLPLAWIKGHRDGDNYVFDNGQYFGIFIYQGEAYPLYFMGCQGRTLEPTPMVMTLNETTGELTTQQWYSISASGEDVDWYDMLANVKLTLIADEPATPASPEVLYYEYSPDDGFGYVMLEIPTTDADGNPLLTGKLGYQLFCDYGGDAQPYIFSADIYGFDEDMVTIPYTFGDDINFLDKGQLVVVYNMNSGLRRIGARSVYAGGGEENFSQIGWYDVEGNSPITPPEDLETAIYTMTAQDLQFGEEWPEDYTAEVKVGFYGSDVYIQGISKWIPEAWIKGTVSRDNMTVEFPQHFLGNFSAWDIDMEIVFNGATFAYNPETDTFTSPEGFTSTSTYELEGETYSEDADVFRDVVITRASDAPATPAAPQILDFSLNGSYGYLLELYIPLEDVEGNPIFASKLSYEIFKMIDGVESPVTLEAQYYEYATEDMTIIPYLYTDYWEVMQGGEAVYVHADGVENWDAIGVKSIYTGGGETHESPITWHEIMTGISTINADANQATEYYDLMGRRVDASKLTRGIYVTKDGRKIFVK